MRFSFIIINENEDSIKEIVGFFENFPNYFCAGIFKDNQNALNQIIKIKPQLVLFSIPDKTNQNSFGLKSIEELFQYAETIPYFIAISNSGNKALEAIQSGVSDFILNPLSLNAIGKSLFKFEKRTPPNAINSICIKSYSDYQFVALQDIVYLKADNNTTDIKLDNGKIINAYKTLFLCNNIKGEECVVEEYNTGKIRYHGEFIRQLYGYEKIPVLLQTNSGQFIHVNSEEKTFQLQYTKFGSYEILEFFKDCNRLFDKILLRNYLII
jgi:CheY-like chemotaxis protein